MTKYQILGFSRSLSHCYLCRGRIRRTVAAHHSPLTLSNRIYRPLKWIWLRCALGRSWFRLYRLYYTARYDGHFKPSIRGDPLPCEEWSFRQLVSRQKNAFLLWGISTDPQHRVFNRTPFAEQMFRSTREIEHWLVERTAPNLQMPAFAATLKSPSISVYWAIVTNHHSGLNSRARGSIDAATQSPEDHCLMGLSCNCPNRSVNVDPRKVNCIMSIEYWVFVTGDPKLETVLRAA